MSDLDNEEIEATKKLQELSADEMFEELGYDHYISDEEIKAGGIFESFSKSDRQWRKDGYMIIDFENGDITILFKEKDRADQLPIYITYKELQAINKKCKELRVVIMEEKEWLKAIKCSKEELIEWLNEMYHSEKSLKDIIRKYEDNYDVGIKSEQRVFDDPVTRKQKFMYYYKVKAKDFEYIKNWR